MNIILIISDTFRYDNLFDRASLPVKTPNLDAFADWSVSFKNFYTGSFPTIPQRTDLITGRTGWPRYGWQDLALSSANALPQLLKPGGFVSQLICDCPHLFNTGFQKKFDAAVATRGQEGDLFRLRMNEKIDETMPREKTRDGEHFQAHPLVNLHRWQNQDWRYEKDTFPPRTAGLAVDWLEDNYKFSPFLLWIDFFDPHEPWDPPEYMVSKYNPSYEGAAMLHPNYGLATDYTQEELLNLRAHYCAEAELVDRWVGRIFQKIDDLDLWENSIVIFTTDHGTSLGDHNRTGKSNINSRDTRYWPIYPEVAHIPFMISAPGLPGGVEVDAIAQPADILPTIADLCGLKLNAPESIHGSSFAPVLKGETETHRPYAISSQFLTLDGGKLAAESVSPVIYTQDWAFAPIGAVGSRELFDLSSDPGCSVNIHTQNLQQSEQMEALFRQWLDLNQADPAIVEALFNN